MLEVSTGRIGEFIACASIELQGWQAVLCPSRGYDLIVTRDTYIYRCQVKASTYHTERPNKLQFHFGVGGKKRRPTSDDYDFAACVSIPHRRVFFVPIFDINTITMSRTKVFFDDIDAEANSFHSTMEKLNAKKFAKSTPLRITGCW